MTYYQLMWAHLATIVPAFLIGTVMLLMKKGSPLHKLLGRIYIPLMLVTATITLFMPALVGPRIAGHFGFIHGFSLLVLYAIPKAYLDARRGNLRRHRNGMISVYVGAILIAGTFALMPGRYIHGALF